MRRRVLRVLAALVTLVLALLAVGLVASESGEVVVLSTRDASGARHETRLWIVEHRGSLWLRAGSPDNAWLQRLSERPRVEVQRDGERRVYTAVRVPSARDAVNARLREKYGLADRWIDWMMGREDAVAVRLDPPATAEAEAAGG